ncbi:aminodeoxychorismate synthase component I [Paenibacillus solani]|uniref:aminodeoxychorismate synthase component I n=1 Tax=Paenibacillus solani TaxID=1705565 RepID=UPI003D2C8FDB
MNEYDQVNFLQFDFQTEEGKNETIQLSKPIKIVQTYSLDNVVSLIDIVEEASNKGYYCAGFISYDAAPAFDSYCLVQNSSEFPLLWFGVYDPADVVKKGSVSENVTSHGFKLNWKSSIDKIQYIDSIKKIKEEIYQGNSYQVNYTMRLRSHFFGNDYELYRQLRKNQNGKYSAYLNTGRHRVLSLSPELFFEWNGQDIVTRPMKGTVQRGRWSEEDRNNRDFLLQSEKERAENIMIVDLLRNDLSRISDPMTIEANPIFSIEKYPTVFQMTSTIRAKTQHNVKLSDVFCALFPCGSITGAPKIRTMRIISDIEDSPRGIYCGAIGLIEPHKNKYIFNVAIRTVIIDKENNSAEYGVGGGITWDSTAEGEYQEVISKAKILKGSATDIGFFDNWL